MMFQVKEVHFYNLREVFTITRILNDCGKDMAQKYGLHHWDNPWIKSFVIVILGIIKNKVYLVVESDFPVATFQTKVINEVFSFEKLAVNPKISGKGIGTFCMHTIEKFAQKQKYNKVRMEVYEKSQHAIDFYEHKGYVKIGTVGTLNYTDLVMEKEIE